MRRNQQLCCTLMTALLVVAAGNPLDASAEERKQNGESVKQVSQAKPAIDDAKHAIKISIKAKDADVNLQPIQGYNGKVKGRNNNALGTFIKNAEKNNPLNILTNTLKNVGKKPAPNAQAKKSKNKMKPNRKNNNSNNNNNAQSPKATHKPAPKTSNTDYTDIEVDENGNPVVVNEADLPQEDPQTSGALKMEDPAQSANLEEFPPYGGDYTGLDEEAPLSYPDDKPPPRRNNRKGVKGPGKKNNKPGKKNVKKTKKKKKNNVKNDPNQYV